MKSQIGQAEIIYILRIVIILIGLFFLIQGIDGLGDASGLEDIPQWTTSLMKAVFGFGLVVLGIRPQSLLMIFHARV